MGGFTFPSIGRQAPTSLQSTHNKPSLSEAGKSQQLAIAQMVTHLDTNFAQCCLTSMIHGRLVYSTCCRRDAGFSPLHVAGIGQRRPLCRGYQRISPGIHRGNASTPYDSDTNFQTPCRPRVASEIYNTNLCSLVANDKVL
ncbi:hypothetical protein M8J77_023525 [Diaphorina citri]|nr:hypothetical protein M8J77_023525 [Diaphorina citri]